MRCVPLDFTNLDGRASDLPGKCWSAEEVSYTLTRRRPPGVCAPADGGGGESPRPPETDRNRKEMPMTFASVCSGVDAASLAWIPLGWRCAFFSEIEPFPCAVLKERWPEVPNLGDLSRIEVTDNEDGTKTCAGPDGASWTGGIDLLVGGTPCQSFSTAGGRAGLEGASGLVRSYFALLEKLKPRWFVWENVPGALSSKGGTDFEFILDRFQECGYLDLAWRVLDAQYVRVDGFPFAVPQRRRRLFVVGRLGDGARAGEVLLEREGLHGSPPPRFKTRQTASAGAGDGAQSAVRCIDRGGGRGLQRIEDELSPTVTTTHDGAHVVAGDIEQPLAPPVAPCIEASMSKQVNNHNADFGKVVIDKCAPVAGTIAAGAHPSGFNGQDAYAGKLVISGAGR